MRIVYAVHGYGRGHASRALAVLPHLAAQHQLLVLAGGDAYQALSSEFSVKRIPTMGFAYGTGPKANRVSHWQTFLHNLPAFLDLYCHGPTFHLVKELVQEFAPDVVISDAEAWSSHVATALKIPRISFDHIGIMSYCRPELVGWDAYRSALDTFCYRLMMGRPDRVIVSSFFDAPVRTAAVKVVGTIPRDVLRTLTPTNGDHLLFYFNRGDAQFDEAMLTCIHELDCPARIYGTSRRGRVGKIAFLPPSNVPFLEDLASCRGVVCTAGNQLVGEAMWFGKPVLVFPENCVEQRMNGLAVERFGIGMRSTFGEFSTALLAEFLDRLDSFQAAILAHQRDGLSDSLLALEQFLTELAHGGSAAHSSRLDQVHA